jgi:DNA-directed RNA polymerase subunit M/transcription elongation factor TFIIS
MPIVNIACPKCEEVFRGSDDVKGTRIRCPQCGFAFVADKFIADDEVAAVKSKAKSKAAVDDDDDDDDPNPYGVKTLDLSPRCPNCANEMESYDAVICLYCGYNTQKRIVGKTKRVFHQTGWDKFRWLLPGIACLLLILVLILVQHLYILVFGASKRGQEDWVSYLCCEPVYLWLTMMVCAAVWGTGLFVFKRLVIQPTPPEDELA